MGMKRTLLSWSSGKDSVWSLHLLGHQKEHEIVGLLTTFNHTADRVAVHAVRRSLVEAQARAAGIPLWPIDLPWPCTNADYECIMKETCKAAVQAGIAIFQRGVFPHRSYHQTAIESFLLAETIPATNQTTCRIGNAVSGINSCPLLTVRVLSRALDSIGLTLCGSVTIFTFIVSSLSTAKAVRGAPQRQYAQFRSAQ
jgi:hypothetical protein